MSARHWDKRGVSGMRPELDKGGVLDSGVHSDLFFKGQVWYDHCDMQGCLKVRRLSGRKPQCRSAGLGIKDTASPSLTSLSSGLQ